MSSSAPSQRLSDTSTFFRTLLESAPDAMVIIDEQGTIAVVNYRAEEMFGYERDELLGRPVEVLLPVRLRMRHQQHRKGYAEAPTLRPMGVGLDLYALRRDGSEFPVEISLSPVTTSVGRFVSSVIRDVTERKQLEAEIHAARETAERANKANSAFLAAASHDLRQPVQALSLLNGALRRTVKDPKALGMIESQDHSLTAMTNLLNSLLDISRLDAGKVTPEIEEFPMQRLVDRLAAEFGRQASQEGLEFHAEPCSVCVRSDPNLLAEIIQNLVSNAIRYTSQGSVTFSAAAHGDLCRIDVTDTGIGIEADQLESIFTEFYQCHTQTSSKEGFGLGLAIVKRLGELLDHPLRVESTPGKGSCFSLWLPLAAEQTAPDDEDEDLVHAEDASGLLVLIEDDVNVAHAWELLLEAEGFEVATAASVREVEALVRHLDTEPDLIVSDYHLLDDSTGVEAVAAIREYYDATIPAFIVSGDTSKVVKDARLLDNCTLLSKPVDTDRLLTSARRAVETGVVPRD
ncbi:MAG: PAS domain S-box protein [Pseudomonadota bacterium]